MHGSLGPLSNREIAAAVWITVFLLAAAFFSSNVRKSVLNLIKQFFAPAIIGAVMAMLLYTLGVVLAMRSVALWDSSLIKDTVFWVSFVALGMLMNASSMLSDKGYFRQAVVDCLKVTGFVEFVSNLYSFSLWIELLMFPVLAILVLMQAIAETRKELAPAKTALRALLLVFGCISLYFTVQNIVADPHPLVDKSNWLGFALPPFLTIALLPFIYFFSLYMQYESLFQRLSFFEKDPQKIKQAKRTLLRRFHLNLPGLTHWAKSGGLWELTNRNDAQ